MDYKERPILMAEDTSKATFYKKKTETRRPLKPKPIHPGNYPPKMTVFSSGVPINMFGMDKAKLKATYDPTSRKPWDYFGVMAKVPQGASKLSERWIHCPYGKPGDTLWVREAFAYDSGGLGIIYRAGGYIKDFDGSLHFKYDNIQLKQFLWKPSIFMPRSASRMNLKILEITAEPLLDITEEGAIAEGFENKEAFFGYWEKLNGIGTVEKNPWVWVIKYECTHNLQEFKFKKK